MAGKNTAGFGLYKSRAQAESAVDALQQAGFRSNDISVLLPDQQSSEELAHEKNTKAPEGTTAGVAAGGTIGGTLGLLAGIGALAIPGVGPFIAAGPLMAALAGAGAGGALGGLVGALVGMGIPEYEAKRYEGDVKDGGILLSVHCDDSDWVGRAKAVLERTGAHDISSAAIMPEQVLVPAAVLWVIEHIAGGAPIELLAALRNTTSMVECGSNRLMLHDLVKSSIHVARDEDML